MKLATLFLLGLFWLNPVSAQDIGDVIVAFGSTELQRDGQTLRLKRGDKIKQEDRVVTGKDARLMVRMNEDSIITLGENTQMLFNSWSYKNNQADNHGHLELLDGVFRFVTGKITQQPNPDLSVKTPVATMGIRGTDFFGEYLNAGVLDAALLQGEHRLEISNTFGTVNITEAGYGVSVATGSKPDTPIKWSSEKIQRALQAVAVPNNQ